MTHPLVDQLRFTRNEFHRGLAGLTDDEARRRFLPMNCISWNVGHLAWQEQRYWLVLAQDRLVLPHVDDQFRYGAPASTPPFDEVCQVWETVTRAADPWLDTVTQQTVESHLSQNGKVTERSVGSLLLRMIYHYWYHTGENAAIRQQLGHTNLPQFVGDLDHDAPYRAESGS